MTRETRENYQAGEMTRATRDDDEASDSGHEDDSGVADDTEFGGAEDEDQATENKEKGIELAKREEKWIFCLQISTALLLICVALFVCLGVFFEGRKSEQQEFEKSFDDLASKLVSSFKDVVHQRFAVIESFGQEITTQANGAFPFVTPRDYIKRVDIITRLSHVMVLTFMPIVNRDDVQEWEDYAFENKGWREEGMAYTQNIPVDEVKLPPYMPIISNQQGPEPVPAVNISNGPYAPFWTCFPPQFAASTNNDLLADPEHQGPIEQTIATGQPSFEAPINYVGKEKDGRYESFSRLAHVDYQGDPVTVSFFPIFDSYSVDKEVKAVFLVIIYWRSYFESLLPPGANGVMVVLETSCNQKYTYRVDGQHATFVGDGDLHETKFDYMKKSTDVMSLVGTEDVDQDSDTPPGAGCRYGFHVYASQEMEDSYHTNQPRAYAIALAALFLFTSIVFLFYGYMVERRQRIVLESAVQSGTLVSSLFPEAVRKQLYEESKGKSQKKDSRVDWKVSDSVPQDLTTDKDKRAAIANLYPETTIVFADLVGFTKWSSTRTPCEVFELLENIYGHFDAIAKRMGVFKVETIGDCYVAVCGLPDPQVDHAMICVKFARACRKKLSELTAELTLVLGEDTATLTMRFGLHSGPVTAGVLRGEKSRFQLFGDSVNTAARMETNSLPGKIQCSEATAEALIARGKRSWLTPREDKIVAKGKGEMQTYWVDKPVTPTSSAGHNLRSSISSDDDQQKLFASDFATKLEEKSEDFEHRLFARISPANKEDAQKSTSAKVTKLYL